MRRFVILLALAGSGIFAACGGGTPEAQPPTNPSASATPSAAPSATPSASEATSATPIDWKAMSHEQRLDHMKKVVMPKMSGVFQAFDGKKYEKFNCVVCHGEGIKKGKFDMPNPSLPHLSYTDGFKKHMTAKPEITKFMMQKVEIEMASVLGMQPYDMKTQQGFGCSGCHVVGP